jgi:hypothetical protein
MNEINEKIDLINKISDYLATFTFYPKDTIPLTSTYHLVKLLRCGGRDYDGCNFSIKDNKLIFCTWMESYHNGDPYFFETKEFELTNEICDNILSDLNRQYEQREFDRLEKLEKEKYVENIRKQIVSAKTRFGL